MLSPTPHGADWREIRLRAQPLHLHRLPQMRRGVPQGEQPRPPLHQQLVHPRARDEKGSHRLREGQRHLRPSRCRNPTSTTCRCSASSATTPLRQGLPGRGHLEGAGRHRGGGLQLVHRLPLLRGGLPLSRAPLQLDQAADPRRGDQPGPGLPEQSHPPAGRDGEVHLLPAPHARGPPARLPGSLPHRRPRLRQPLDPDSEIRWVLENKRVFVLKEELGTKPRFFYFFDK
jgi:hypothetical protein